MAINNKFNYLENIFDNHLKKIYYEKFPKLKISASLFNNFYSKFIQ